MLVDCKTVRIFAHSSTREQSNKRSGMRVKTESETGERRYVRVRLATFARVRLLRHALLISLLILRKKPTVLQSNCLSPSPTIRTILELCKTYLITIGEGKRLWPTLKKTSQYFFIKRPSLESICILCKWEDLLALHSCPNSGSVVSFKHFQLTCSPGNRKRFRKRHVMST